MNQVGDAYYNSAIYSVYDGKIYGIQAHIVDLAVPVIVLGSTLNFASRLAGL